MAMDLTKLQQKLLAVARRHVPGDQAPYAFEKRIMARIASTRPMDALALWSGALWRSALSCLAVTLLMGVWLVGSIQTSDLAENFSEDFEHTVFAGMDQQLEDSW